MKTMREVLTTGAWCMVVVIIYIGVMGGVAHMDTEAKEIVYGK